MKANDIGIALTDNDTIFFNDIALGPVHAVQSSRLHVDRSLC